MFKAIYLTEDPTVPGARRRARRGGAARRRRDRPRRVLDRQLQGRARDHRPVARRAQVADGGRHRRRGRGGGSRATRRGSRATAVILNGWGVGETHWGCLAQKARAQGRLAGAPARRRSPRARRWRSARRATRRCSARWRSRSRASTQGAGRHPRHRRHGRRGQRRGRDPRRAGATASSPRPARRPRRTTSRSLGAAEVDRPQRRSSQPGKPLQKERWAGRGRFGRQPHARQRLRAGEVPRRGGRLRPRAGHGLSRRSVAPFILRGVRAHRRGQRHGAARGARGGLGAARRGPRPRRSSTPSRPRSGSPRRIARAPRRAGGQGARPPRGGRERAERRRNPAAIAQANTLIART